MHTGRQITASQVGRSPSDFILSDKAPLFIYKIYKNHGLHGCGCHLLHTIVTCQGALWLILEKKENCALIEKGFNRSFELWERTVVLDLSMNTRLFQKKGSMNRERTVTKAVKFPSGTRSSLFVSFLFSPSELERGVWEAMYTEILRQVWW